MQRLADKGHSLKTFHTKAAATLGKSKAMEGFATRMALWVRWSVQFAHVRVTTTTPPCNTDENVSSSQATGETENEQLATYLANVVCLLEYADAHYLSPVCQEGCPCHTPTRELRFGDIQRGPHALSNNLCNEMQCNIIKYLGTKDFVAYTLTCRALYDLTCDPQYQPHFEHCWWKKKFIPPTALKFKKWCTKICELFDVAIQDVHLYVHKEHTCHNKGANRN